MEDAYTEGKIRAIGVSNFQIEHLEALLKQQLFDQWSTNYLSTHLT